MSGTPTPIFPQTISGWQAQIVNGTSTYTLAAGSTTTTGLIALATGSGNGFKIESITVTANDTVSRDLVVAWTPASGGTIYVLGIIALTAASAATTVTSADVLSQMPALASDPNGNPYIYLPTNAILYVGVSTGGGAVTSGDFVNVVATGGTF